MDRLYRKYNITKADGSPCDAEAQYFVLRLDTDPAARAAAITYANSIVADKPEFAIDIYLWVEDCIKKAKLYHPQSVTEKV